jgi:hypothetical protein
MNRPDTTRAWPWVVFGCSFVAVGLVDVLTAWQYAQGYPHPYEYWPESTAGALSYGVVGLLIALRVPGNRLGPLMLGLMAASGLQGLAGVAALVAVARDWPHELAAVLGGLFSAGQLLSVFSAILMLLLAPTGRPLNRFWAFVVAVFCVDAGFTLVATVLAGALPNSLTGFPTGLTPFPAEETRVLTGVANSAAGVAILGVPLAMIALAMRWFAAHDDDRRRITWVVIGGLAGPVLIFGDILLGGTNESNLRGSLVWGLAAMTLPAGIGMAVLRHGLYQLDRIVSRTVSYVIVTGAVLGIYVTTVALLSSLVPDRSSLPVAAATLVAAAAFQPVLRRVRGSVDRRFNREHYDGLRTVDEFGRTLRHVIHPDEVTQSLLIAVDGTLKPTTAGLWLRSTS